MRFTRDLVQDKNELEMTPMIDVTFLLLIFFMCTLRFKSLEGLLSAHLPKDHGVGRQEAEPPVPPVEVRLRLIEPGTRLAPDGGPLPDQPVPNQPSRRYIFGPDRVVEYAVGPVATRDITTLEDRLARRLEIQSGLQEEPVRATIEAGPGIIHQDVMAVLDRLTGAGFQRVGFVGRGPH
jgi:biopolymer transport protein ExbD